MIKWVLVYIVVNGYEPIAINPYADKDLFFDDIATCFYAREDLAYTLGGKDGHYPNGSQAVCIPVELQ